MTLSSLKELFSRVLKVSMATPLVLGGCGRVDGFDASKYTVPKCTPNGSLSLADFTPAVIPDLTQHWQLTSSGPMGASATARLLSELGTACATAADKVACQSTLSALKPLTGFRPQCLQLCIDDYLTTTRGDEVKAVTTTQGLIEFLGAIDTLQEAAFLAYANGYQIGCGDPQQAGVRAVEAGFEVVAIKGTGCGANNNVTRFFLNVKANGDVSETASEIIAPGDPKCSIGRRPHGLCDVGAQQSQSPLGSHFGAAARLEAASVTAFLRLERELRLHGAPSELREEAIASAREEVTHAEVTTVLARRFGAEPSAPTVQPLPLRPLFEVTLDNAVEGCVRETYGALVALHQARHAKDSGVRAAMHGIAEDETRHAALSWKIDAWAQRQLSRAQRAALRAAQKDAIATLRREVNQEQAAALTLDAGLPDRLSAGAMLDSLERELWSSAGA